jgi:5-methylcytosine-specific restriction endonuclease McrA
MITRKYKLEFAVDPGFMEKLVRVRSILSTKYIEGLSLETVFDITMSEFLDRHSPEGRIMRRNVRKKRGSNKLRRSTGRSPTKRSRHIPPEVRDEAFVRDGGRCTFIGDDGRRYNSDWNLQMDLTVPFARGRDSKLDNLRLLCAKHNRLAAEKAYGMDHMAKYYLGE